MIGPIILLIILIFLNATFASAEIAVISMNDAKLKKMTYDGDKRAIKLSSLVSQPSKFLATIQVAITLAGLLSSAFAADNFAEPLVETLLDWGVPIPAGILNTIAVFLITLILAYFNLVFGELVPKRIAMKKAESMALGMSGMLYGVSKIFAPIVFILTASTNLILRIMGIDPDSEDEKVSEEEIRMLLLEGNEQGTIKEDESSMIENIFDFDDTSAEQICTHRLDVISININDSLDEWENIIHSSRHTHYPVYRESTDDIVGVLDTKDYFRLKDKSKEFIIENAIDKPFYIPESMKANVLFQKMKSSRTYFAVIIDEYGGLSGIITLHDLMEALVGDIYDEEEESEPIDIQKLDNENWLIYGGADLDDVSKALNVSLPNDYDTFSGFVCGIIGRIPNDGESFSCEYNDFTIQVHSVANHIIEKATVCKNTSAAAS